MLQLHNAMWPGIVGKGEGTADPVIPLERMLDLTTAARYGNTIFNGVDISLLNPHASIHAGKTDILRYADRIAARGLQIGSLCAPVWSFCGGGSAMGTAQDRKAFINAVRNSCEYAQVLNEHGIRSYGVIRIDSADSPANWSSNPAGNTRLIAQTFREAAVIAADYGERLAAEGEICWAGMHTWQDMLNLLEEVGMPAHLGFQADLAHTYLYLMGYNSSDEALLSEPYTPDEFWAAYKIMTDALAPWVIDFHVAQSNGSVFGSGLHDKTGRHCTANAPDGRLDVIRCAQYWLLDEDNKIRNGIKHICWDGCMFPNSVLETQQTWIDVLKLMLGVQQNIDHLQLSN